ncbi:hypothetical protein GS921_24305 [Rhodococcus hoagii]|nr:hypothetical protein [Prescottella equi]NKV32831.1 hypothetical protein [Prescottella equi]
MITLAILIVLELILIGYIISRILRYQVAPNPTLRAATLTAISLLVAMLSVTEPVELVLRGPDGMTVGLPTLLKHLGLLGCGAGVLLMALAQRQVQRAWTELLVWAWFSLSAVAVIVLHVQAGESELRTSVGFVVWSHTKPELIAAMLIAYVGGLAASLGVFAVIWPLNLRAAAGRGLAIMAVGAFLSAVWCGLRIKYVLEAVQGTTPPDGGDFLVTQLLSLCGLLLLNIGLVWSTAEADFSALRHWRHFRVLNRRVIKVLPEVQRTSDYRLGVDAWIFDRAVEVLDGLHQFEQFSSGPTGFPQAPETVGVGEVTKVVADVCRQYQGRNGS